MSDDDKKLSQLTDHVKAAREDYNKDYNPDPKEDKNLDAGARAGIELVGAVLGGALLGYGIDYLFKTSPAFFIIFILLGTMTGFYNIYKITMGTGTSVGFKGLKNDPKDGKQDPNLK